jgi:hypothetical protein
MWLKEDAEEKLEAALDRVWDCELDVWEIEQKLREANDQRRHAYQNARDWGATYESLSKLTHAIKNELGPEELGENWEKMGVSLQRIEQRVKGK